MLSLLLREKLTEVHEELQKKQELIEDLQPDISQNGKCSLKSGSAFSGSAPSSEGDKNRSVFTQCV
jgi:predicted  nucleic acid-binding Zn-ribbon protein